MNTYKLKFTILQQEILRLLCIKAGEQLTQRQIARFLHVSAAAVGKVLPQLVKEEYVRKKKQNNMNLSFVSLNRDKQEVLHWKRTENLRMLYERALVAYLKEEFPGATIVLFGSYARGDDVATSDIDIAVLGRKERKLNLERFEKQLERKIVVNYYPSLTGVHKELRENLCNGIVLSGGIQFDGNKK